MGIEQSVENSIRTIQQQQRGAAVDDALRSLYAQYRALAHQLARTYRYSPDEVDAIGMYCVWRTALAFKQGKSSYFSYLYRALVNELNKRYTPPVPQTEAAEEDLPEVAAPESPEAPDISGVLKSLRTDRERQVVRLVLAGLEPVEVAERLGVSRQRVYAILKTIGERMKGEQ